MSEPEPALGRPAQGAPATEFPEGAARNCGPFPWVILEIPRPNIETFSDRLVQLEEIMGATEGKNHLPQKTTCTVLYHV